MNSKNWAEQFEEEEKVKEGNVDIEYKGDTKIVTEIVTDEDGAKTKIIRKYKIETRKVPKPIATRKLWKKFGDSVKDIQGPNASTTSLGEEIFMEFISTKGQDDDKQKVEDKIFKPLTKINCRLCQGDHFTSECTFKDRIDGGNIPFMLAPSGQGRVGMGTRMTNGNDASAGGKGSGPDGKYVPPHLKRSVGGVGTSGKDGLSDFASYNSYKQKDECTVKVTNLSAICLEKDLYELFGQFGEILRTTVIKDKHTKKSKGIAYVTFKLRECAHKSIIALNNFGYDNMILKVEWTRPSQNP